MIYATFTFASATERYGVHNQPCCVYWCTVWSQSADRVCSQLSDIMIPVCLLCMKYYLMMCKKQSVEDMAAEYGSLRERILAM